MKIIRHLNSDGVVAFAQQHADGRLTRLEGDPAGGWQASEEPVQLGQILTPVDPPAILCTGLNYRQHAEETKAPIPKYPVLFMKMPSARQHPD